MARKPGDRIRDAIDNLKNGRMNGQRDARAEVRIPDREVDQVLDAVIDVARRAEAVQEARTNDRLEVRDVKALQQALGTALQESIQVETILESR